MRNFIWGMVASLVLIPIGMLMYFVLGFSDVGSDGASSRLESRIMKSAVRSSVRRSASGLSTPESANDETLVEGGKLYVAGCAGCHGELGKPLHEDRSHFPPAPQLAYTGTEYSEPELYWIVKHGIRMTGMSAYGPFYSEQKLWALAAFLHRIKNLPPEVLEFIRAKKE